MEVVFGSVGADGISHGRLEFGGDDVLAEIRVLYER